MKTLPIVLLVVAVVLIAAVDASNDTLTVAAQTLGSAPATISGKASRRGSSIAAYRGNVPLPVNIKSPVPPSLKDDAVAAATAALGTLSSPPQDTAGISLAGTNEAVACRSPKHALLPLKNEMIITLILFDPPYENKNHSIRKRCARKHLWERSSPFYHGR